MVVAAFPPQERVKRGAEVEERLVAYFEQFRGPVLAYLRSLRIRHCEAEEIIQETFMALHAHLGRAGDERNIRGWVFRVAHNIAISRLRSSRHEEQFVKEEWVTFSQMAVDRSATPDQAMLDAERRARMDAAVARLSPQQLQCLNLRTEGFRYREIGEILGVTTSTVAEMLRRAITKLNKESRG